MSTLESGPGSAPHPPAAQPECRPAGELEGSPGPSASTLMAIDPGPTESAYAIIEVATRRPVEFGKVDNTLLLDMLIDVCLGDLSDPEAPVEPKVVRIACEMIGGYGQTVGQEVFDTCVWIGRFRQMVDVYAERLPYRLVQRRAVKLHHCQSAKATDANITTALRDRFAPGQGNYGKGTKTAPGFFYGFSKDVWQAYALAVQQADELEGYQP